jgi:hypothetical protein
MLMGTKALERQLVAPKVIGIRIRRPLAASSSA